MTSRVFALTLAFGITSAATALVGFTTVAPAAVPGNEGYAHHVKPLTADVMLRRNGPITECNQMAWPLAPASCIRHTDQDRANKPVRIIPIYASPNRI